VEKKGTGVASIYQQIEILSKEKGIDAQIVLDAVKDAMLMAARKHFKGEENLVAELDGKSGSISIFAIKTVADPVSNPDLEISPAQAARLVPGAEIGAEVRLPKPTDALGRIAAQMAKQVILQKVREAERENIHSEYSGRVGELVNCIIKRAESLDFVVDLGKTEARLPKKEQSRLESFSIGERVRGIIKSVERTGKNAGVVVSRGAPELVMRLFEQEVPEIYDGTVVIRGCAREAGERTKIAVLSRDRDVDCVGACVGMKGMRVQSIIRELRGEKIDIIEYSDDPIVFATHALSPARISRVAVLDSAGKHMEVIVEDAQLSLAIGKKGQNVRLAAKLLGWRIDIKTEEEKRHEAEAAMASLSSGAPVSVLLEHGLTEELLEALVAAGVGTVEKLGAMTPEQLEQLPGLDAGGVSILSTAVNAYYGQYQESDSEPAGEPGGEPAGGAAAESPAGAESAAEPPVAAESAEEPPPGAESVSTASADETGMAGAAESGTIDSAGLASSQGSSGSDSSPRGEEQEQ
jgi:N utilization substance protein A